MKLLSPDPVTWNALIRSLPAPHLLQSREWAQVKAHYGWKPMPLIWEKNGRPAAAAMVLKRSITLGGFSRRLCILYAPKGPLLDWSDDVLRREVLDDLQRLAHRQGAIFLKVDPDVRLAIGLPGSKDEKLDSVGQAVRADLEQRGWFFSDDQIQFRNTVVLDLTPPEEELLARMKPKTRYNIRLAERKGVRVRQGTQRDFPLLYRLYAETSLRDGFVIRQEEYYRTVWEKFLAPDGKGPDGLHDPGGLPLIAEVADRPVAALFLFWFAGKAYYLYGMSSTAHRDKMPNHLLQWEAIRLARAIGCQVYDLWGAPDVFQESDRLWGVFRFKEGFGGQVVRTLGAWDYAPSRWLYRLYTQVMPGVLEVLRARGRARTRQEAGV